jgi:preprotein translocase subunit SecY
MIIFASIVSGIPSAAGNYWAGNAGEIQPLTIALLTGVLLASIAIVVFFERAQRRIPIQYSRRQVGRHVYGGQRAHLPLKVNMASMIPPIFAYTSVTFQPVDVAENLKKQQANIPGIRPGKQTAEYIDRVLTRLTTAGSIYIAAICVVPAVIASSFRVPFQFGGTSLMIVVGVALETVNQIEAHLITRSYEGLTGPRMTRLSGRRPA